MAAHRRLTHWRTWSDIGSVAFSCFLMSVLLGEHFTDALAVVGIPVSVYRTVVVGVTALSVLLMLVFLSDVDEPD
ncbi:hypothetical protein BV210_12455 [Halorientalis sp. IM1011]|jgi:hypothetical protein|nr:hypothetical protein BV210_12455 [Halorientalis sp. IM1011]